MTSHFGLKAGEENIAGFFMGTALTASDTGEDVLVTRFKASEYTTC